MKSLAVAPVLLMCVVAAAACGNRYDRIESSVRPIHPPTRFGIEAYPISDGRQHITGTVVAAEADTLTLIRAARVRLFFGQDTVRQVASNARGEFAIDSLRAGLYRIDVAAIGYESRVETLRIGTDSGFSIRMPLRYAIDGPGIVILKRKPWWKIW